MGKTNEPRKIIIHHSGDISTDKQFSKVDVYHKNRFQFISALGYYVGYHYFIERDGEVRQARNENEEGAHTIGHNLSSIGIGLAGDFSLESPTAAQRNALVILIKQLLESWQIPETEIYPHRAFADTICYGENLSDEWGRITYKQYKKKDIVNWLWTLREKLEKLSWALRSWQRVSRF